MINIYKKSKKPELIDGIYSILVKKYSKDVKIWIAYLQFLFDLESENSQQTLKSVLSWALQSLTKKANQITLISQYAIQEFKHAHLENGRTMLDSILNSNPKRTDIMSIYIDLEIKHGKQKNVRQLLDRLIQKEGSRLKEVKFLLKRYLEYEVQYGTPKDVEKVKRKAEEIVKKLG